MSNLSTAGSKPNRGRTVARQGAESKTPAWSPFRHIAIDAAYLGLDAPISWLGFTACDRYFYFDTITLLCHFIPEQDLEMLRGQCSHLDFRIRSQKRTRADGSTYEISRYHPYCCRIEAQQPTLAFIEYFTDRNDHLSRVDLAQDLVFDGHEEKSRCMKFVVERLTQPYQQAKRGRIVFDNGSISSVRRPKGYYFTAYDDEHCRIDGQLECFHIERRTLGTNALRALGIHHARDLLSFDHVALWNDVEKRCFREIDLERLARFHMNRLNGGRRRSSQQMDRRRGGLLYRIYGADAEGELSVQRFIWRYGSGPFLKKHCNIAANDRNHETCKADAPYRKEITMAGDRWHESGDIPFTKYYPTPRPSRPHRIKGPKDDGPIQSLKYSIKCLIGADPKIRLHQLQRELSNAGYEIEREAILTIKRELLGIRWP